MSTNESFILFSNHYPKYSTDCDLNSVGQKGLGLFRLNHELVPPFFIIKSNLFKLWLTDQSSAIRILRTELLKGCQVLELNSKLVFIVRSSAKFESFDERGFYESSSGNLVRDDLLNSVLQIWTNNLTDIQKYPENEFAVIVQQYVKPKYLGHLSNERRVSRNKNEWLIELAGESGLFSESIKFKATNKTEEFENQIFTCRNKKQLLTALKKYAGSQIERGHIEWVWDGLNIKLVQNDSEVNNEKGQKPSSNWIRSKKIIEVVKLKLFNDVRSSLNNWRKVECLKTFINCDLPHGQVYILEDSSIIQELNLSIANPLLVNDIKWLLLYPITIRMDVKNADGYNNILLPRTETLFEVRQALEFLIKYSKEFIEKGLKSSDFCFLIHRFIISESCALAFSKPNLKKARIDSTWGIVEGLYFHPHDSFEVNLINEPPKIKKQIRCKTEYIDVDKNGKWFSKKCGINFDWAESLSKKQIIDIASYNIKIAEYLDRGVTVMYFVGVDQSTGYPEVLPWFYTTDEITETSEKFTDVIFSVNRFLIENEVDFQKIQENLQKYSNSTKVTLKLKLNPDISRDKKLIEAIGNFAKTESLAIELEGSILSHTYYILRKLNVRVKCREAFAPKYKKQEFYKLVRDKIPINIESKGEKARTIKIPSNDLLQFIKEKAIEEALEFYFEKKEDKIIEELADMYEIIRSACKIFGMPVNELVRIADNKTEKKGAFETGVILLNTEESSLIDIIDVSGNSLIKEEKEKKSRGKILKKKKISFGLDNTITLPYILSDKSNDKKNDLSVDVNFKDINLIKISYTPKGIKLSMLHHEVPDNENVQLDFAF